MLIIKELSKDNRARSVFSQMKDIKKIKSDQYSNRINCFICCKSYCRSYIKKHIKIHASKYKHKRCHTCKRDYPKKNFVRHMHRHYFFADDALRKDRRENMVYALSKTDCPIISQYDWSDGQTYDEPIGQLLLYGQTCWLGETERSIMLRNTSRRAMNIIIQLGNSMCTGWNK